MIDKSLNKIAVLLSGHLRTHEECFQQWNNIIYSQVQPDIFVSTWNNDGRRLGGYKGDEPRIEDMTPIKISAKEIQEQYDYTMVEIESYEERKKYLINLGKYMNDQRIQHKLQDHPIEHIFPMWYKRWRVMQLCKQHNIAYDYMILSRPDFFITQPVPAHTIAANTVYLPWYNTSTEPHDWFMIADTPTMHIICDLAWHIDTLVSQYGIHKMLNCHELLYYYLQYKNITIQKLPSYGEPKR